LIAESKRRRSALFNTENEAAGGANIVSHKSAEDGPTGRVSQALTPSTPHHSVVNDPGNDSKNNSSM